jgi:hypothetical protein
MRLKVLDLRTRFPAKPIPSGPFIGMFGSAQREWRSCAHSLLTREGVSSNAIYDSTDEGWSVVNDASGDQLQSWINELVARQQNAIAQARCILIGIDGRNRDWARFELQDTWQLPPPINESVAPIAASRTELGLLGGMGKRTIAWIPSDMPGRNYLRAFASVHPTISCHESLAEAATEAARCLTDSTLSLR